MPGTTTSAPKGSMMEDGCLAHADFFIGREFWTETGHWLNTFLMNPVLVRCMPTLWGLHRRP